MSMAGTRVWTVEHDRRTGEMTLTAILVLRDQDGRVTLAAKPAWSNTRTFDRDDVRLAWTREKALERFVERLRLEAQWARQAAEQAVAVYLQACELERETIRAAEQASA